jgi:E3 ubiquitin-protein ligase DOA10
MDHTLRIIQHNWVVLAYNFNVVMLVLIIGESSIGAIFAYHFTTVLSLLLYCLIILFLHLLSTNHKCTQPCYFTMLLKPAAQKEKMD